MREAAARTSDPLPGAANPWREALYRLRAVPLPIYLFDDATLPAASLWAGARLIQREEFAGDDPRAPVVLDGAPSPRWLCRAVAALFAGRTLCAAKDGGAARFADAPGGCCLAMTDDGELVVMPWAELLRDPGGPAPESLGLPARDWHEPAHFAAVLRSLLVPTHFLCAGTSVQQGGPASCRQSVFSSQLVRQKPFTGSKPTPWNHSVTPTSAPTGRL